MKITLLGVLAFIGITALLLYVGNEWQRTVQAKAAQPPQKPEPLPENPDPFIER